MNFLVSYILSHPSLTMCNFAHLSHIVGGYILPAGMRVWVVCTRTRTRVPDGYMMLPICVLVGKNMIPYPPLYRVNPSGTRVSGTHCHLYPHLTPLATGSLNEAYLSSPHLEASPVTTFHACSSPAPTLVKPQPAPTILSQELVHTTLSITHHTRKRPSSGPRTTHGPH
jgi:hypothetical protein